MNVIEQDVSRETFENIARMWSENQQALELYADRLLWWNAKVNLLSRNTKRSEVLLHIRHSLYLHALVPDGCNQIVDAGSGGGLPGIPLAITLPDKKVELVDVVQKKVMVTDAIKRELGLTTIRCTHMGIERFDPASGAPVLVSKHAFKIADLLNRVKDKPYTSYLFLKGDDFKKELSDCEASLSVMAYRIDSVEKDPFFTGKFALKINMLKNE